MEKKIFLLAFIIITFTLSCFSQMHDNIWLMGYQGGSQSPNADDFGISIFDFSSGELVISDNQDIEMNFLDTNTSFCDKNGNLEYYTNGIYLEDASFQEMQNGADINDWLLYGMTVPQGVLTLPFPEQDNQSILLHEEKVWIDGFGLRIIGLYYSLIDMENNNGLGEVILKKEPLIIDTLQYGKLTATKHANGRDWWILTSESNGNLFYKILLDDSGFQLQDSQIVGLPLNDGLGQAVFSPDGNYYVIFNSIDQATGQFVDIYDFDRCNGDLANHQRIHLNTNVSGGVAISPNSRYLYVSSYEKIYQYDLWEADIESTQTTVAIYDGFQSPFPTRFFLAQLAPDGKIYLNSSNGSDVLHVIHEPNQQGSDCNVEQHGILLPTNNGSLPSYPNYRLGALMGSICDSLTTSTKFPIVPNNEIEIYPNPVQDYIKIVFDELPNDKVEFLLYNSLGQKVLNESLFNKKEHSIELKKMEAGIYFYIFAHNQNVIKTGKLMKL